MALTDIPNIGKELARKLELVGIHSVEDLRNTGAMETIRRINNTTGGGCINMLYALEGAIQGVRWHTLSKEQKRALLEQYRIHFGNT